MILRKRSFDLSKKLFDPVMGNGLNITSVFSRKAKYFLGVIKSTRGVIPEFRLKSFGFTKIILIRLPIDGTHHRSIAAIVFGWLFDFEEL